MQNSVVKNSFLHRYSCTLRLTIVACLLLGMFFSGGEGIRLLPFSDAPDSSTSEAIGKKTQSYVLSVHGAGGRQNRQSTELQKNLKDKFLTSSYPNLPQQEIAQISLSQPDHIFNRKLNFSPSFVLRIPSDRAPPRV